MDGEELLARVYRAWGGALDAQFDYATFQRRGGDDRHATAMALDDGTWDYPMIVLATPRGIRNEGAVHAGVRTVIVEGISATATSPRSTLSGTRRRGRTTSSS